MNEFHIFGSCKILFIYDIIAHNTDFRSGS